jgi:hypothetical protein
VGEHLALVDIIVGASGLIGAEILRASPDVGPIIVPKAEYRHWAFPNSGKDILGYLRNFHSESLRLFVATGIVDPLESADELTKVNYWLPKNIYVAAQELDISVISLGSISELFEGMSNPYIDSKRRLTDYLKTSQLDFTHAHFLLHSVFGPKKPPPFMFLGQMLNSIKSGTPFEMSSGVQLREYHHAKWVARSIFSALDNGFCGISDLSHGQSFQIREVAKFVFEEFEKQNLLEIGRLAERSEENFGLLFRPSQFYDNINRAHVAQEIVRCFRLWLA